MLAIHALANARKQKNAEADPEGAGPQVLTTDAADAGSKKGGEFAELDSGD